MATTKRAAKLLKQTHRRRPDRDYFVLEPEQTERDRLLEPLNFDKSCDRSCTRVIDLLPKTNVAGGSGVGYQMINIDGYRMINAYVISDPLNSTSMRGFTLELSFSLYPFVYGVGVVGETSAFFNFSTWFEPGTVTHGTAVCQTSDLTTIGSVQIKLFPFRSTKLPGTNKDQGR